jgi:hypothetical protein
VTDKELIEALEGLEASYRSAGAAFVDGVLMAQAANRIRSLVEENERHADSHKAMLLATLEVSRLSARVGELEGGLRQIATGWETTRIRLQDVVDIARSLLRTGDGDGGRPGSSSTADAAREQSSTLVTEQVKP